jgi:MFS family permease
MFDPASAAPDYIVPAEKHPEQAIEELRNIGPVDAKLQRKIDFRLLPILGAIYFIIFLDQVNLANAAILGLVKDLKMPSNGFNTALWIFYIPLFFVEVPSNVLLSWRRVKPRYYIGTIIFVLGILSMCMGLTHSYSGLLGLRFLAGICEAAFPSAAIAMIGAYYAKEQVPIRYAFWFSAALVGCSFGGLLAYALNHMKGIEGMAGWRWMFVIEGLLTLVFAVTAMVVIPNFPHEANFLTDDERARLINKLVIDRGNEKQDVEHIEWFRVIFDYKKWLM